MDAKAAGKAMKAKGLTPLRFYCPVCQKGMRDANGLRSHERSENHLRLMAVFRDDPDRYMKRYSDEFERNFLECLRVRGAGGKVAANRLYQDVIRERHHTHMSSTYWATLGDFVGYLGKTGKAEVTVEEDGSLYVRHINRDKAFALRKEQARRLDEKDRRAAERESRRVDRLAAAGERERRRSEAAAAAAPAGAKEEAAPARGAGPVAFQLGGASRRARDVRSLDDLAAGGVAPGGAASAAAPKRKATEMERLVAEEEEERRRKQAKRRRARPWLAAGLVVKAVAGPHRRLKGEVVRVHDGGRAADVAPAAGGDPVRLLAREVETVIPAAGRDVLVVDGAAAAGGRVGAAGTLEAVHAERFSASVRLAGDGGGAVLELPLECVCKVRRRRA